MGEVPHHYLSQVLLNLEICDLELAHFIEFIPGNSDNDFVINIVEVKRDREWFARELPKMKAFWDNVLDSREKGIETNKEYTLYKERCDKRKRKPKVEGDLVVKKTLPLFLPEIETDTVQTQETKVFKPKQQTKKVCLFIEE